MKRAMAILLVVYTLAPQLAFAEEFSCVSDKPEPLIANVQPLIDYTLKTLDAIRAKVDAMNVPETVQEETYYTYDTNSYYGTDLMTDGVVYDGGTRYTWYSERVLPGGGLDIPGRHVNSDGFVCDANGRIAVASSDLPYGTSVSTPWGDGVVYDGGCASGTIDIYTSW